MASILLKSKVKGRNWESGRGGRVPAGAAWCREACGGPVSRAGGVYRKACGSLALPPERTNSCAGAGSEMSARANAGTQHTSAFLRFPPTVCIYFVLANIVSSKWPSVPSLDLLVNGAANPEGPECVMEAKALRLASAWANFPPYLPPSLPESLPPVAYLLANFPLFASFPQDL
ncbi:unnamed protein product [Leptidea sinapis]|uniref:Uncharacterized protein n=1 Tax=Leptidea sinapis TaxID=189913 RepID=A0A5E4R4U1_9NEOP|nr:unnamed protein product [Leptidea sinapis]